MFKSLNVFGAAVLFVLVSFSLAFAQATTEQLVVTTYFPSPAGSYRELRAQRMAIGDNYYDASCAAGYNWAAGCGSDIEDTADLIVQGRVGIGTFTPAYALEIGSDSAGKPTTNTWTISSDRRLKKNITPLKGALSKMVKLQGVTFQWKEPQKFGNMNGTYMGLIGQEVEKVIPEWVGTNKEGYKTITVGGFEALTAEAIKELKAENDSLKTKNMELESRIRRIESRLR